MLKFVKSPFKFSKEEDGGMTLFGLYFGAAMLIIGSLAVDINSILSARTQLQTAADFAGHAALYQRLGNDKDVLTAKQDAIALVRESFPTTGYGDMLEVGDIHFGRFDPITLGFEVDETSHDAVLVKTDRLASQGNPVSGYLSRLIGYHQWDAVGTSVYVAYRDGCLRDGWVAEDTVDAQSNNVFITGFCIHSNTQIEFNSGSYFETGVTVSAPAAHGDVTVPSSGYDSNIGLYDAIVPQHYNLRILNQFPRIYAGLTNPNSEYYQPYLADAVPFTLPGRNIATADFQEFKVNTISCTGNQQLFIDAVPTLRNVVIATNCKITFRQDSALENVVVYTTHTDVRSVTAPNGLRLGLDDDCDPYNGARIMTHGGFEVAQDLQIYSSQVLARGPIQFAAAANGVEGGSFISGVTVDGTSNTTMGTCDNSGGAVFEVDLFRLAL